MTLNLNTAIVVPVQVQSDTGKPMDLHYRLSVIAEFPTLEFEIAVGTPTTLTPKKEDPTYKSKGLRIHAYQTLAKVSFDKTMTATFEKSDLINQPISAKGNNAKVYLPEGKTEDRVYANHLHALNKWVFPTMQQMMLNPAYLDARFDSWALVGLHLMSQIEETVEGNLTDSLRTIVKGFEPSEFQKVILQAHADLMSAKGHISPTHAYVVGKLKALPQSQGH